MKTVVDENLFHDLEERFRFIERDPGHFRAAVVLLTYKNYKVEEIADLLLVSEHRIKSILADFRKSKDPSRFFDVPSWRELSPAWLETVALVLSLFGFAAFIFFLIFVLGKECSSINIHKPLDYTKMGTLGDFIGGSIGAVWTFAGILFFWSTIKKQEDELKYQRSELRQSQTIFKKQQFESTFFHLLEANLRLVETIEVHAPDEPGRIDFKGKQCFVYWLREFNRRKSQTISMLFENYGHMPDEMRWSMTHFITNLEALLRFVQRSHRHEKGVKEYYRMVRAQLSREEQIFIYLHLLFTTEQNGFIPLFHRAGLLKTIQTPESMSHLISDLDDLWNQHLINSDKNFPDHE